jgi:hypothetical protein
MRLLIIGSFGSVSLAGRHSLIQRYIQIVNQDSKVIISCVIVLLVLLVVSNVVILLFSSTTPISNAALQLSVISQYRSVREHQNLVFNLC